MSESGPEKVEIEESEEKKNILVVDPDDYKKTQKLKSIQEAKDHYKDFVLNEHQCWKALNEVYQDPNEAVEIERCRALAHYGSELLPLIEEGLERGAISEDDMKVETNAMVDELLDKPEMDIREIIELQGRIWANGEKQSLPRRYQKRVYRQFERLERKLGLGLDIEEDKGPANI